MSRQTALIKKDIKAVAENKRMFSVLLIVPLVLTVFMPTVFILALAFSPTDSSDFQSILALAPENMREGDLKPALINMALNRFVPVFFLLVPIMAASVMAASSFVGEKEKKTLETLLYSPLTLRQIYTAKILASFLLSMFVSLLSFAVMIAAVEAEVWVIMREVFIPDAAWLVVMLLMSPALSFIAVSIIVRGSAKAKTMEESQQRSVFLILPIVALAAGQFAGVMLLSIWALLGFGAALAVVAFIMARSSFRGFTYERLLK